MKNTQARVMAFGRFTLKVYLVVSALMFFGGLLGGAALAVAGYDLASLF